MEATCARLTAGEFAGAYLSSSDGFVRRSIL